MKSLCLCLLVAIFATPTFAQRNCPSNEKEKWSYYGSNGPNFWGNNYPICNGNSQSPIAIDSSNVRATTEGGINGSYRGIFMSMENNGHAVELKQIDRAATRYMVAEGTKYELQNIHFHFGSEKNKGSEHVIDNQPGTMEMHMVHKSSDGKFAVLGVIFEEGDQRNDALEPIVRRLRNIRYKGQKTNTGVRVQGLMPPCTQPRYFKYPGSLTVPECTEGLQWFVLNGKSKVSSQQMAEFRKLFSTKSGDGDCLLADNVRPLQNLNDRQVVAYTGPCPVIAR